LLGTVNRTVCPASIVSRFGKKRRWFTVPLSEPPLMVRAGMSGFLRLRATRFPRASCAAAARRSCAAVGIRCARPTTRTRPFMFGWIVQ
jgi:hypothetical protein